MNEEGKFWASCWAICGATVVGLAVSIGGCTAYGTYAVKEMTAHGADPMRSACAVSSQSDTKACAILAAKEK